MIPGVAVSPGSVAGDGNRVDVSGVRAAFGAVFADAGLVTGLMALSDLGFLQPIRQSIDQVLAGFGF